MITFSDTTTSDAIFYQPMPFIGYSHVQGLYPKKDVWTPESLLYFTVAFRKSAADRFNYGTKFTRKSAAELPVSLPIKADGNVDFDFMCARMKELEDCRMQEFESYLIASGFEDCELTQEEKKAILDFENDTVKTKLFKIGDLFVSESGDVDIQNKDVNGRGVYFVNSGVTNLGIKGKTDRSAKTFSGNTLTIDFFGNTYYRPFEYKLATHNHVFSFSGESLKDEQMGLYYMCSLSYLAKKYSLSNMATRPILAAEDVLLPVTADDAIDVTYAQTLIRAIQKGIIANVKANILE